MRKMTAEHRPENAPPPAFPMLRHRRSCSTQLRATSARPPFRPSRCEIGQRRGYYTDPGRWVGAMVAERPVGWDVRAGDMLSILKGCDAERCTVSQEVAIALTLRSLAVSDGAIGPATSRGGHRVVAGDGTNGLLTVGPTSRVSGNCSSVSLEMRGATTAGPLCADEPESGAGRGLVDMGARAIKLASVDWRGVRRLISTP